jgi:hypothetical protein
VLNVNKARIHFLAAPLSLLLLALISSGVFPGSSLGEVIALYDGTTAAASTTGDGVIAGDLTARGSVNFTSGANFPGRALGYDTFGWPTGTTVPDYNFNSLLFRITADADHRIELSEVHMWFKSSGNGPDKIKLELTVNNIPGIFDNTVAEGVMALSNGSAYEFVRSGGPVVLQPLETATFFIVGYDYKVTGSNELLITDIELRGTTIPVPEPRTSALLLLGALAGLRRKREPRFTSKA